MDEGTFTVTYKYAVLLGLIHLYMENTPRTGEAPDMVTSRQLAGKVLEIYWPQSVPFHNGSFRQPRVLNQNRGDLESQARSKTARGLRIYGLLSPAFDRC